MIYLDTTAMLKLIVQDPETEALTDYLSARTDTVWFTCALARAELLRATAPLPGEATEHAHHILAVIRPGVSGEFFRWEGWARGIEVIEAVSRRAEGAGGADGGRSAQRDSFGVGGDGPGC